MSTVISTALRIILAQKNAFGFIVLCPVSIRSKDWTLKQRRMKCPSVHQ